MHLIKYYRGLIIDTTSRIFNCIESAQEYFERKMMQHANNTILPVCSIYNWNSANTDILN